MNGNDSSRPLEHVATRSEKHRSFSRKILSSVEIAFEDRTKDRSTSKSHIAWKAFKCVVFLTCLAYLLNQSAEFYGHFYTYPTNINIRVESLKKIKLPASTLCYRNRISANEFCEMYPNLCESPKNVKEYCLKHSEFCTENISALMIPKHGYYTTFSREVSQVSQQLLVNRSDDMPFIEPPRKRNATVTFIQEGVDGYVKCYSENLHLYQSRLKQRIVSYSLETFTAYELYRYNLSLHEPESFDARGRPQAFFAIHPPFNPLNPVYEGHAIRSGHTYVVEVNFEEYHLLPLPYPTNCTNYNVRLRNINETKPRSQEMCRELCRSEFFKQCIGCDMGVTMHFTKEFVCHKKYVGCHYSSSPEEELSDARRTCLMGCNPDCVKLKYPYTVVETENERNSETGLKNQNTIIVVLVKTPEVKIMSHDPLYAKGELFSYIGGLIGCWLGISVWAFTSIFEKFIQKIVTLKRNYRQKRGQPSSGSKNV
ncbi:hypothetical protein HNY73_003395 [Argiope bruennichi]|uniref:Uncharacterized protein n=1 Tax=Argiope bruennichi TaxID=94029 RepID=A0A8T0FMG5_ARGBR|nr:hypothetical protein HNY73_003395 [Argiope bruennichi]